MNNWQIKTPFDDDDELADNLVHQNKGRGTWKSGLSAASRDSSSDGHTARAQPTPFAEGHAPVLVSRSRRDED